MVSSAVRIPSLTLVHLKNYPTHKRGQLEMNNNHKTRKRNTRLQLLQYCNAFGFFCAQPRDTKMQSSVIIWGGLPIYSTVVFTACYRAFVTFVLITFNIMSCGQKNAKQRQVPNSPSDRPRMATYIHFAYSRRSNIIAQRLQR